MPIPHGLIPPASAWFSLRIVSLVSASLSIIGSAIILFQLLTTKLLVTNRKLLVPTSFSIFVSHIFIVVGADRGWGSFREFCTAQGIIITLFVLNIIVYTAFIGINTYRSLVLFSPPSGTDLKIYHTIAWSIPIAIVICASAIPPQPGFALDWSGYCSISSKSTMHLVMMVLCLVIVVFDVLMCIFVIRNVHSALENASGHLSPKERNNMEARLIVLIIVTFGMPFLIHAALYINEIIDENAPVLTLFYLDALLTYSSGFLLCCVVLANPGARSELWINICELVCGSRVRQLEDVESDSEVNAGRGDYQKL